MSATQWVALGALALAVSAVALAVALWPTKRAFGARPAEPGPWFGSYHTAWTRAHPRAFERGTLRSGNFCLGRGERAGADVWCSSTLDWDREWFRANGMGMPRHTKHVDGDGPPKPNEFRIGTLGPGESVAIPIVVEGGAK